VGEESWNRRSGIGEGGKGAARGGFVAKQVSLPKPGHVAVKGEAGVTTVKRLALAFLHAFGEAEAQLVGKAVILTDGTAGTVEAIWLDDFHGLRVSIRGHPGKRPVSAVKFAQS
jgi:hypothetical protein